jgi:very-short-patch-repair endonuclease
MLRRLPADRLAASQFGVISRAQALDCGVTDRALHYRIRPGGAWRRILPGIYVTSTGPPGRDQRLMAALLYAGEGSIVTGQAALRHYKISVPDECQVDVLVPASRRRSSDEFVVVRRTTRMPRRYAAIGPIQFAPPERAVADAALGLARLSDVRAIAASAVQRGWCTVPALAAEVDAGPHRDAALLRRALEEIQDGIRSAPEGDLRILLKRARLPDPMFNARLYLGDRLIAVPDAWWPHAGLVVEVDSREWHLSPVDWERTMRRHADLTALGILVLHFSPRQIRTEPDVVIAAIRAALQAGSPVPGLTTSPAA